MIEIGSTILMAVLGWALTSYVRQKTNSAFYAEVILRLLDAVAAAVKDVQQFVDAKEKSGAFTDAEQAAAKCRAVSTTQSLLGPKGVKMLTKAVGVNNFSMGNFIGPYVEAEVRKLRKKE